MTATLLGIHHVTAIAGDPQRNVEFYAGTLGLRLVKITVNFDDPGTYHLYYGDEVGHPGTILTFFPWPGAPRGRRGTGQVTVTAFAIPRGAAGYWADRLKGPGVEVEGPSERFGEPVLALRDPDGLALELIAGESTGAGAPWAGGPVEAEAAIRGFHSVTLTEAAAEATTQFVGDLMGFAPVACEGDRQRFRISVAGASGPGGLVDVLSRPDSPRGMVAVGTVHHVAWRIAAADGQRAWRRDLDEAGVEVTPIVDRRYFHSIYFREPGGVLFEIATDPPGFTIDEPRERLGARLQLPAWLEPARAQIEERLPPLRPVTAS
ncbi:MAG: ring-cleaving dioxygenase [Armatimonadetes bacterium]|nr:ring-cleaving dioxygenase [Armatimonadota bacterium]